MTAGSIKDGFKHLRSDEEMLPLADAAICRSEADWLVGINGTRAMTAFNSKSGGFHITTVGRVQTPTLAILVEREEKIKRFVPKDYWEVHATFGVAAGEYAGRWIDEKFAKAKKDAKDDEGDRRPARRAPVGRKTRRRDQGQMRRQARRDRGRKQTHDASFAAAVRSHQPAARGQWPLWIFSARTTLSLAQALYEKHKVLTYPRTDSRALPEDYLDTVKATLDDAGGGRLRALCETDPEAGLGQAQQAHFQQRENFRPLRDHSDPAGAQAPERDRSKSFTIWWCASFWRCFIPARNIWSPRASRASKKKPFKSEGKVLVNAGWLEVYGKAAAEDGDAPNLVAVKKGEKAQTEKINVLATQTKPPARFTEATLLTAMEGAGKLVEDEELRDAMKERGLGTPATRAVIIEGLIAEEYLEPQWAANCKPRPRRFR